MNERTLRVHGSADSEWLELYIVCRSHYTIHRDCIQVSKNCKYKSNEKRSNHSQSFSSILPCENLFTKTQVFNTILLLLCRTSSLLLYIRIFIFPAQTVFGCLFSVKLRENCEHHGKTLESHDFLHKN